MAALAVLLQTSLLLITILGAEAVGGVLSVTTVLESAANRLAGIKDIRPPTRNILKISWLLTTSSPKCGDAQGRCEERFYSNQTL